MLILAVTCHKSCYFMSKMENQILATYGYEYTNSMTNHIFGGLFQRLSAEHSFPGVGEEPWQNSKATHAPCWEQGTQTSSQQFSGSWTHGGREGCWQSMPDCSACSQTAIQYGFYWCGQSTLDGTKKNPHICCCFVNYLKYYLGFTWNSLTTARFCWECQGKKLFYSPPLSEYILLECSSRDEGNYRLTRIVKWCQIASKSASF